MTMSCVFYERTVKNIVKIFRENHLEVGGMCP